MSYGIAVHDPITSGSTSRSVPAEGGASSRFTLRVAAEELSLRRPADQPARIARVLRKAIIDLNPHQVDAAVAGLHSLGGRGLVLADEVGLGKTIEAGLVLAQLAAEGKERLLVLAPASLRKQWAVELDEKLGLSSVVVEGRTDALDRKSRTLRASVFDRPGQIVIASHPFAARRAEALRAILWDCIVIDEAHRLRGLHRGSKTARAIADALEVRPKLLLTATPLQNGIPELFGILSLLDREALGPFDEFRAMFPDVLDEDRLTALKSRVQPLVHRTLRRQVREYVRYTDRRSIVCEFSPTTDEQRLYDEVSEYLSQEDTLAIPQSRRALMVLVYRKLLASSPAAIASTLERLASSLSARLDGGEFDADDEDTKEIAVALADEIYEDEEPTIDQKPNIPAPERAKDEVSRLRELAALAASIRRPSKTEALLAALDRAFTEAASRGWPMKAVVFTESRKTQSALREALEQAGHAGKVLELNGSSGGAEERAQIVEDFRSKATILILTEAGAEGLNLQFANLVVNYDLPWNPQRIEQRIGRCHRYGQTRDVVVLNFLSRDNAAESRLYELLSKKLQLFDGVFGASDEPLGALGDGAGFERRVLEILESCRGEEEIKRAFDALQAEVEDRIKAGIASARAKLCDHFDDDVRARLRTTASAAEKALEKDENALVSLVCGAIPEASVDAQGNLQLPAWKGGGTLVTSHLTKAKRHDFLTVDHPVAAEIISDLRTDAANDIRYVVFDYTGGGHKVSRLVPLLGSEGWWLVYRVSFDGPLAEDHIVHVVVARSHAGGAVILDDAQIESLLGVKSRDVEPRARIRAAAFASTHAEAALAPRVAALAEDAKKRAADADKRTRISIDLALDGRLEGIDHSTREARAAWKKALDRGEPDEVERRFRELRRALEREGESKRRALQARQQRIAELDKRARLETTRTLIATAYFWIE